MAWSLPSIPIVGATIEVAWGNAVRDSLEELRVHDHTAGTDGDGASLVDLAAGTPSMRTIGTGAQQIAAGNHTTHTAE